MPRLLPRVASLSLLGAALACGPDGALSDAPRGGALPGPAGAAGQASGGAAGAAAGQGGGAQAGQAGGSQGGGSQGGGSQAGGGQSGGAAGQGALGPSLSAEGAMFRLWAPNAEGAEVEGDFSDAPLPMEAQGGGVFGLFVPGAKAGQRFRYRLTREGQSFVRVDPRARALDGGWGLLVDPSSYGWKTGAFQAPSRRELVLYELHVGSFHTKGEAQGTFASAAERLDELVDLGVNAIELMPTNQFGGNPDGWGYNPQAYFAPKTSYGGPDDLRRLVDEAHGRGIAVLLDVVYNHYDGWTKAPLFCFDGLCPGKSAGVYFFDVAPYDATPWGPRPAFDRPEVARFLLDGLAVWLTEYRVDGFRWDSTSNIRGIDGKGSVPGGRELMRQGNELTAQLNPGAIRIAEDLKGEASLTRPLSADDGAGFDAQWDGFGYMVVEQLVGADDKKRSAAKVAEALLGQYNGDPFQRLLFVDNHDTAGNGSVRLAERIDPADPGSWAARKRSLLAAALLLTAPGVPMLFMGQEMLERGSFTDPPAPLDWGKAQGYGPVRGCHRELIRLRRNLDGATPGLLGAGVAVHHVNDADKVIAYRRWDKGDDDAVVIVNLANRSYAQYDVGLPAGGTWRVRHNTDAKACSNDFAGTPTADVAAKPQPYDKLPFRGGVALGPYSAVVLSR